MSEPTGKEILDLPMGDNDADASTIGEYLQKLLFGVWNDGEGFSGKRPFGNSGWEYELYDALAKNKVIEDEDIDEIEDGRDLINKAIEALYEKP